MRVAKKAGYQPTETKTVKSHQFSHQLASVTVIRITID